VNFDHLVVNRERVISVKEWAEIRRLRGEDVSISEIARLTGTSRNTVKAALASTSPPRYQRPSKGSAVDAVEPRIRELLREYPRMPATVIAERVGWTRGLTVFKERVAQLRPVYLPPDPASRTTYLPGEVAQFDFWFPPVEMPVGFGQVRTAKQLPVLTMACGYSRWRDAILVPSRSAEDLFAGWWTLLERLGKVPRVLVWDGESAVGKWRPKEPALTEATQAFRGLLGTKVVICRPGDPEAKGLLERTHDHYETSFLPGRTFVSPADFNTQFSAWVAGSNQRTMRVLGCAPADRVAADKAAMLPLPPVAPVVGWRTALRLPRDHYVRLDGNDYSIHPAVIGRRVEVRADLTRVVATCDGQPVADHDRSWAKHQTFTDPGHAAAAVTLRRTRLQVPRPLPVDEVEQRDLSVYDQLGEAI
jgi:transposase